MQPFSFISILLVAMSAFAIAHAGEEYALPTAIGVSVLSNSFSATSTVMIWQAVDSTISTTFQPIPTGSALSSAVSFIDSILTDSQTSPTPATSSIIVSIATPTDSSTSTVVLTARTSISSTCESLVSSTKVSSTLVSLTRSSASTTTLSTTRTTGAAAIKGVRAGLLGVAVGVLAAL